MLESKLYLIATPLGNRQDITLRALELLRELKVFFAEDTRELGKLFELVGVGREGKELHSYASHNMKEATRLAISRLEAGIDIGFVSDRGTPGISDPGAMLAREARAVGAKVLPVPGPSSVSAALSVSGFDSDRFLFLGFLPAARKEREASWTVAEQFGGTSCFFESPKRIRESLEELAARFPHGTAFVAREMTKLFEEYRLVKLADGVPGDLVEKGEFVVAFVPGQAPAADQRLAWEKEVASRLLPDKAWAKEVAARTGASASEIYNALQKARRATEAE